MSRTTSGDPGTYNLQPPERDMCEELDALKRGAVLVFREARKIRRSRSLSERSSRRSPRHRVYR